VFFSVLIKLENSDLTACDREPIHMPGSIQPHGIMLIANRLGMSVRQGAGDIERVLGVNDWLDQPLNVLIGDVLANDIATATEKGVPGGFVGQVRAATGQMMDVTAHLSPRHIIVELEAASTEALPASKVLDRLTTVAAGFERAASVATLCENAAVEFRRLTGYDRVMIYRFLDDDAGEVVAEDRQQHLYSFLHHHFPASDIPQQARSLYLLNLVRVIPDITYQPIPLRPQRIDSDPLDMSASSLRSVSPLHLQYLANMGVRASASFSIVKDGLLWGLIACHNETPRALTYDVRAAGRSLAGSLSREIKAKEEAEGYRERIRLRSFEDDIVLLLSRNIPLQESLSQHLGELGRMMAGDGIAVLRGRDLITSGVCPDAAQIRDLAKWLMARSLEAVFTSHCLPSAYFPAMDFQALASGILAITMSRDEPWMILWFRAEQVENVRWAGNPHKPLSSEPEVPLSPRASFDAWAETVRGRARAWSSAAVDAAGRLRTALLDVQQRQHMRDLNRQLTVVLQDKQALLHHQEFLIGEVNHRVQNSLTLVSTFITLQSRASDNAEVHEALEEARRRLTAVALVHRRLYRGDRFQVVDAAHYIEELCADTFSFMGQDWKRHLTLDLAPITISTDQAVTLGLLVTELMINSNKHAYGGKPGPIEIRMTKDPADLHLSVADKGLGKVAGIQGFGSRIVKGLVSQLEGQLTYSDNAPGLRTVIKMPMQAATRLQ
jgi:chemotaxis family two-component system sensor kinase Cph1